MRAREQPHLGDPPVRVKPLFEDAVEGLPIDARREEGRGRRVISYRPSNRADLEQHGDRREQFHDVLTADVVRCGAVKVHLVGEGSP